MPSVRIDKTLNNIPYFLTFTVKNWYYLFDRYDRWKIISKSLQYCKDNKNLKLYALVFMPNHIHLIAQSDNMTAFVRDFKKFTSKEMKRNIEQTEPNILKLFLDQKDFEFWSKTNMPKLIESELYYQKKLRYIHENPIKKNYVMLPEHWYWSSANSLCELKVDRIESN